MSVDARAAASAAAHRRVKRCLGLLRAAAATLAPDAGEVDLVGELRIDEAAHVEDLRELARLSFHRYGPIDVVLIRRTDTPS